MEHVLWVVAILISIVIAHFYYRRALNKTLSFFLLLDDRPLSKMDQNVRSRLTIKFSTPEPPPAPGEVALPRNQEAAAQPIDIGELHHLQVVIANTGVRAISFISAPVLSIPPGSLILDASIICRFPEDLSAELTRLPVEDGKTQDTRLTIPLLNRGDWVLVKFLLSGVTDTSALKLHTQAEDLSRTISIKPIPADATKSIWESIDWAAVWIGSLCIIWGFCIYVINSIAFKVHPLPDIFKVGSAAFFSAIGWIHLGMLVSATAVGGLSLLGIGLLISLGLGPVAKRNRIVLPKEFRPR